MALTAIELRLEKLRSGAYPETLNEEITSSDDFAGLTVNYVLHDDGSATLSLPGTQSLWVKFAWRRQIELIPLTWELP